MNAPAVSIRGLSKSFSLTRKERGALGVDESQLGAVASLVSRVLSPRARRAAAAPDEKSIVVALKDISLDVMPGEVLGVIGRNGAGKSTLLKVLARVIDPTEGRIVLRGRVASLLELGLGFSPELTLRENIRLYGRLAGLREREISAAQDRIFAFAELEEFRDSPLAKCPSGAFIRLAFSALVNMRADIILADEVLAVGDSAYRHACEDRIRNAPSSGETVLFVSHDMSAIRRICTRVAWIDHGRIRMVGAPHAVVAAYEEELLGGNLSEEDAAQPCRILDLRLLGDDRAPVGALQMEAAAFIECMFRLSEPTFVARLEMELWQGRKRHVFTAVCPERFVAPRAITHRAALRIPADFLNEAAYEARCRIALYKLREPSDSPEHIVQSELAFNVFNTAPERSVWADWKWGRAGLIAPRLHWALKRAQEKEEQCAS